MHRFKLPTLYYLKPNPHHRLTRHFLSSNQTPLENAGPMACLLKTRSVIRFSGPDTVKFLQGLVTNDVRRLGETPSASDASSPAATVNAPVVSYPPVYAAMLTAQGRFLYDMFLYRPPRADEKLDRTGSGPGPTAELELFADVDGSVIDELLETLKKYRLRSKVDIASVSEEFSCWQRFGQSLTDRSSAREPEAAGLGWGGGVDRAGASSSQGNGDGWLWYKDPRLNCLGFRGIFPSNSTHFSFSVTLLGNFEFYNTISSEVGLTHNLEIYSIQFIPTAELKNTCKFSLFDRESINLIHAHSISAPLVEADKTTAEENYLLWRLEKGVAEGSLEIPKGEAIPLEYNLAGLNAISFDKGCYIGQELIARTHHRGIIRKRLLPLRFLDERGKDVEQKVAPKSEVIDAASKKKVGTVTTALGSRGLALLRLEEAFKASGSLTIQDQDIKIEVIKPDWWPAEWLLDHQQTAAA